MECPEDYTDCINSQCEFHGWCRKLPKPALPPEEEIEGDEVMDCVESPEGCTDSQCLDYGRCRAEGPISPDDPMFDPDELEGEE